MARNSGPERDGGIEVPTGDAAERVDPCHRGQAEGEGYSGIADAGREVARRVRGEHRGTATGEHQPEGTDQLRCQPARHSRSRHG